MVCVRTEVRQAIAKAIDRSYVTDSVYARHATASTLPVTRTAHCMTRSWLRNWSMTCLRLRPWS